MLAPHDRLDPGTLDSELNELLAHERGWLEVCAGLTRILLGWGVLFAGFGLGAGLLVLSTTLTKHAMYWSFFTGLACFALSGFFSWTTILSGLLRCVLHSPERNGVRWFIFVCMVCLALGPVLNIMSSFLCSTKSAEFNKGVEGLKRLELDSTGKTIQAVCMVGSVGYHVAFLLFLRSIGCCFWSVPLVRFSELYLLCYAGLVGATFFLVFFKLPWLIKNPAVILLLGLSYLLLFGFYVALVLAARICIGGHLGKVRTTMGEPVFAMT